MTDSGTSSIASWRIGSDEERRLRDLADESFEARREYAEYYRLNDPEYYEKGLAMIDKVLLDFGVGPLGKEAKNDLVVDMVYSLHRFGCMFDEYFLFGYPHLNTRGRESFVTDKTRWAFYERLNGAVSLPLFADKRKTYEEYAPFYRRKVVSVAGDSDFGEFKKLYDGSTRFFVKPSDACCGRGAKLVDTSDYDSAESCFETLLSEAPVVCEELIVQSAEMAELNPSSVNTVRMPTVRCKSGVRVLAPFLRMGHKGSVVDNAGAGGVCASVDEGSGIVLTPGFDQLGKSYVEHPDTRAIIPGFRIPRWGEALSLVAELAEVRPEVRYVGWDLALTDEGWVVVEGNDDGMLRFSQTLTRRGLRDALEAAVLDI